jgi:hypothetical protein
MSGNPSPAGEGRRRAGSVRVSRPPGVRELREMDLEHVPAELQDFVAGCAWAPGTGVVDLTDPDTGAVVNRLCAVMAPPDERLQALFEWRQRLSRADFRAAMRTDWKVLVQWGAFPLIAPLPALVRVELRFQRPRRFTVRIALFADQAIPALQLVADGALVLLVPPEVARTMRCADDLTANALPICDRPSESVRRLLALMREDGRA